jgi:hypothetical protein
VILLNPEFEARVRALLEAVHVAVGNTFHEPVGFPTIDVMPFEFEELNLITGTWEKRSPSRDRKR